MPNNAAAYDRCYSKRWFSTREDATEALRHLWTQHGSSDMTVYACQIGQAGPHFHIGHNVPEHVSRSLRRLRSVGRDTVLTRP